jgi:oxalyl-CoA decarboxylase
MLKARHELMIEAFGGTGHQATTPTEVAALLREALGTGAPTLIDCVIDPSDGTESGNIAHLNPKGIAGSR